MSDSLGLCYECLLDNAREIKSAEVLVQGTGYCQFHAREFGERQQRLLEQASGARRLGD